MGTKGSYVKPEEWFWLNVKCLVFGFLILHITRKHRVSFISISFARGPFFFDTGLPPDASYLLSKIKLKSSPKIMFLLFKSLFF